MNNSARRTVPVRALTFFCIYSCCMFVAACSIHPSESTVERLLAAYFTSHHFHLVAVKIDTISSQPIGQVKYMGTKGYHVAIRHIILEVRKDTSGRRQYLRGERITLREGTVIIREDPSRKGKWLVSSISSSLMP